MFLIPYVLKDAKENIIKDLWWFHTFHFLVFRSFCCVRVCQTWAIWGNWSFEIDCKNRVVGKKWQSHWEKERVGKRLMKFDLNQYLQTRLTKRFFWCLFYRTQHNTNWDYVNKVVDTATLGCFEIKYVRFKIRQIYWNCPINYSDNNYTGIFRPRGLIKF